MLRARCPASACWSGADRYLSGRLAERRLGATVHLLDDGFQHLELARDVDLLLRGRRRSAGSADAGRAAARAASARRRSADAALITAGYDTAAERIGRAFGIAPVFRVTRIDRRAAQRRRADRDSVVVPSSSRVFVVTGIARTGSLRRRTSCRSAGTSPASIEFRDHHRVHRARRAAHRRRSRRRPASMIVLTHGKGRRAARGLRPRRSADRVGAAGGRRRAGGRVPALALDRIEASGIDNRQSTIGNRRSAIRNPQSAIEMRHRIEYLDRARADRAGPPDARAARARRRHACSAWRSTPSTAPTGASRSATWPTAFPSRPAEASAPRDRPRGRSRTSAG